MLWCSQIILLLTLPQLHAVNKIPGNLPPGEKLPPLKLAAELDVRSVLLYSFIVVKDIYIYIYIHM